MFCNQIVYWVVNKTNTVYIWKSKLVFSVDSLQVTVCLTYKCFVYPDTNVDFTSTVFSVPEFEEEKKVGFSQIWGKRVKNIFFTPDAKISIY